ncbi:MAG: hypothetical protein PHO01_13270 [Desulfotomaculaceae bacterium]|nr:hypothetical protein [Desulfotomaculaceae bacterium]
MPGIIAWLAGLGLAKLAGLLATVSAAGVLFYHYSYQICLMGAMVSLLFTMFGFRLARTGVMFFVAVYVVVQVLGVALRQ